jgi:hypothetical protein
MAKTSYLEPMDGSRATFITDDGREIDLGTVVGAIRFFKEVPDESPEAGVHEVQE